MKPWLLAGAMALTLSVLSGCSGRGRTVEIDVREMAYSTNQIVLKAGVPVRLVLVNRDSQVHDLSVYDMPVAITPDEDTPEGSNQGADDGHGHDHESSSEREPDLHLSAQPGRQSAVEFVPVADGTYEFVCTVPGHEAMGMKGTLIVTANGKLPKGQE